MQYAKIIVDVPLTNKKELIYSIPADLLLDVVVGKVVEIPLINKYVYGVISGLTKYKPFPTSALPISRILSEKSVLSKNHLDFYDLISIHYLCDLSETIFAFLPPVLKKIPVAKEIVNNKNNKKGKSRFITGTLKERFDRYKKLIKNFNGTIIFVFPDYLILNNFSKYIFNIRHSIYTGNINATKRWKLWEKAHNETIIILSTRIGIGLLPSAKYIIVIDDPDHPGFKEDQKPKYQISELIKIHLEVGSNIVVGLSVPSLKYKYLFNYNPEILSTKNILISGSKLLPENLLNKFNRYQRILIGVPHKYAYGLLICKNCAQILRCNDCKKPLIQENQNNTYCKQCKKRLNGFPKCKICQNHQYAGYQFGTNTIKKQLSEKFPNKKIVQIDQSQLELNIKQLGNANIVIATSKIFDYPVIKFDLSICVGFDEILDAPFYDQEENCAILITKLLILGKQNILISNRTQHRVIQAINSNNINLLWNKLLEERKPLFPPFVRLIEIEFNQKPNEKQIQMLKGISVQDVVIINNKTQIHVNRNDWIRLINIKKNLPASWRYNPEPR